jgi:hypothetical protein
MPYNDIQSVPDIGRRIRAGRARLAETLLGRLCVGGIELHVHRRRQTLLVVWWCSITGVLA